MLTGKQLEALFTTWLEKQPDERKFNYCSPTNCAIAACLKETDTYDEPNVGGEGSPRSNMLSGVHGRDHKPLATITRRLNRAVSGGPDHRDVFVTVAEIKELLK